MENILEPIIIATKIRLIPHSQHRRTVCLRFELFGCRFQGLLLSLSEEDMLLSVNSSTSRTVGIHF